jgi:hypothetical protein
LGIYLNKCFKGSFEFNGKYHDNSDLWTTSLKQKVGYGRSADDGIFFMTLHEF